MKNKLNLAIICGGRSFEYAQSISSAFNMASLLEDEYKITILCINKNGEWFYGNKENVILSNKIIDVDFNFIKSKKVEILNKGHVLYNNNKIIDKINKALIITNGIDGNQGSLPGMLKLLNIPCVGSDMFTTVICADKEITKSLLKDSGFNVVPYLVIIKNIRYSFKEIVDKLGLPFVIKPSQLGCSAGVSKVEDEKGFLDALNEAFKFDEKIIIEKYIKGREMEVGIIAEDNHIVISPHIAEITSSFYSFEEKFISNENNTVCPAKLSIKLKEEIKQIAKRVYYALNLKLGFYRLDFFIVNNKIYINEINTFPLFTSISLFPKMWGESLKKEMINIIKGAKI
jgi:D-alanine-D-alanine ligase